MIKVNEIQPNDVMAEISHYRVLTVNPTDVTLKHLESGQTVNLSHQYVSDLLHCAEQWHSEVKVGREDKYWTAKQIAEAKAKDANLTATEGDVRVEGIRTLFENIRSSDVFTVCFVKQDKPLSQKAYDTLVQTRIDEAVAKIEAAKNSKKSVTLAAATELQSLILNPVLPYTLGEDRILRGYKVQFTSRDGRYDCMDMDEQTNAIRPVNINSIKFLIHKGIKYTVE